MNFLNAARAAMGVGNAIRCAGWIYGVAIRWNWNSLRWEGISSINDPDEAWAAVPNHPNPQDIQRTDWEVVEVPG